MNLPWCALSTVFVVAAVSWFLAGRKGLSLLKRHPSLLLWSSLEERLGVVCTAVLAVSCGSRDWSDWRSWVILAMFVEVGAAGCVLGGLLSGVVLFKGQTFGVWVRQFIGRKTI